jgi:hypothetical protein
VANILYKLGGTTGVGEKIDESCKWQDASNKRQGLWILEFGFWIDKKQVSGVGFRVSGAQKSEWSIGVMDSWSYKYRFFTVAFFSILQSSNIPISNKIALNSFFISL